MIHCLKKLVVVFLTVAFASTHSFAAEPSLGLDVTSESPAISTPQEKAADLEWRKTFKRHRWLGIGAASLLALNVGLGVGMTAHGENREPLNNSTNTTVRALHMVTSLSLVGFGVYQFFDGRTLRGSKEHISTHAHWAYPYLAMLVLTGTLGVLSSHLFVDNRSARTVLSGTHMASGVATLGLQWGALIHIPFGFE